MSSTLSTYQDAQGRFTQFPGKKQKKKQLQMLYYLGDFFKTGRQYSEPEVNDILNVHHTFGDPASLRRLMFGQGILGRTIDGKAYWKRNGKMA